MFVLFNKNLNRYFKHPKVDGIWWSSDLKEANVFLESIKQFAVECGFPELIDELSIQEISENTFDVCENHIK